MFEMFPPLHDVWIYFWNPDEIGPSRRRQMQKLPRGLRSTRTLRVLDVCLNRRALAL